MVAETPRSPSPSDLRAALATRMQRSDMPPYVYAYPPKTAYRPCCESARALESWSGFEGPLNLYVHVPYCAMKCSFCNLFATVESSASTMQRYVDAVFKELNLVAKALTGSAVEIRSVYLGGGTPTSLGDAQLASLLAAVRQRWPLAAGAEISIEAAPGSLDEARCERLRELGFSRLSIGIQSFDEEELQSLGRGYGADHSRRMAKAAVECGPRNVNLDLIYGLERQTLGGWLENLETALEIAPPTLTLYPLVVRQRTTYGKRHRKNPEGFGDSSMLYDWYDRALALLEAHGYRQHTFVTFARDGGGCGHEASEFAGVPTLGIGAGARSYAPCLHYTNDDYFEVRGIQRTLGDYFASVETEERIPVRCAAYLDLEEIIRRRVILGLLSAGVDRDEYRRRFDEAIEERFAPQFVSLCDEGCLKQDGAWLRLTKWGKRFSSLIADFLASRDVIERRSVYG